MASKNFLKSFLLFHRFFRRKMANTKLYQRTVSAKLIKYPSQSALPPSLNYDLSNKTLVIDMDEWLLKSNSSFPYFMLVALEGGSFLRGLFLLLLYPFLLFLNEEMMLKVMVMVCFFGMKVDGFKLDRAVLPKYFLENVALEGFEILRKGLKEANGVVCVSKRMPRVMVNGFLKDYMGVKEVVGREIGIIKKEIFTGALLDWDDNKLVRKLEAIGGDDVMAFGSSFGKDSQQQNQLFSECYTATETEKRYWKILPREMYPEPLIFHDGRLAFTPTPTATLAMFLYLPLGLTLSVLRALMFGLLPYSLSIPLSAMTGSRSRIVAPYNTGTNFPAKGQLFVCNHRTLLDPIGISVAINRPVTAVTYSLSRLSEIISPIQTTRLTRDREEDRRRMSTWLARGDLVVCPEGTTCREPFLLRFSPLFAELTDSVVPVALRTHVDMFHGTSTSIFKFLDPFYFLMNPMPEYWVEFLEKIPTGGKSIDIANSIQRKISESLGFKSTELTRKHKYRMLAGNEGIVKT